ncbi:hypothetical protein PC39_12877 [Salinisphaera sp. PC39]|uniref:hypothetical protein n=1 Tax=Salinisphaera sp. PC39 TaxID=1304156 RepID=UPI003340A377
MSYADERQTDVSRLADVDDDALAALLARFGLTLVRVPGGEPIPGSFWGEEEAGLAGDRLYARPDTPLHSILHESGHYICMDPARRSALDTDAGGDYDEENGVCYLQILLADHLPDMDRDRMCADMDAWGYTFRLGSAAAWFAEDAADARAWLQERGVLDRDGAVTWRCRGA